jgi:hypothetical protein
MHTLTSIDMSRLATCTNRVPPSTIPVSCNQDVRARSAHSVAQRIIIKVLKDGVLPSEIVTRLQAQFGEEYLSQARVSSWAK